MVRVISLITARISCLRWLLVVAGASKTARMSAPARVSQASSSLVRCTGCRVRAAARPASARSTAARRSSSLASRVRATSRLPGSTSSCLRIARLGFEPGPLQRQLERGHLVAVPLLGVGHRPGGGLQRRRLQHPEQLVQYGAVQVGAADALAWRGAIQLGAAPAQVPGRVTAVPGVADLHHPAALAAADQPGQQRRALPGGAAAVPARRP